MELAESQGRIQIDVGSKGGADTFVTQRAAVTAFQYETEHNGNLCV